MKLYSYVSYLVLSLVFAAQPALARPTAPELLSARAAVRTCTAPCPSAISGTWTYFATLDNGDPLHNGTFTVTQSSNRVNGSTANDAYRIFGNVESTGVNMTWVVKGEELEGYVLIARGHYWNRRLMMVFEDSQGRHGSLTAFRP